MTARRLTTKLGHVLIGLGAALAVGIGVPLAWVWIGSLLQGAEGRTATSVNSSTAAVMLVGIVVSYVALMLVAGWIQGHLATNGATERGAPRHPWNRSLRDEPYRPGQQRLGPLETAFVLTAMATSAAFVAWYVLAAGSPIPQGA